MEISKLNWQETKTLLKDLRLYKDIVKKLGSRWKRVYNKIKNNESYYLVEYYPQNDMDFVYNKAKEVYEVFFKTNPDREKIKFIAKENLWWWMKIYMDDNLVDLSFDKIERKLKK